MDNFSKNVFLSCSNLTLGQYRRLVLARALTGAAGCVVSIAVLVIILLATRKKAWENLSKRVYIAIIFYNMLYSAVAIAAVNYSRPPSHESAWCRAMGFLLHYTGTLAVVHYGALAFAITFQVTLPVYQIVMKKSGAIIPWKAKLWEVILFLVLFLCPLLITWEPFLPQLSPYGNYGPLCWFSLELTDNCSTNMSDETFLQAVPYAVLCLAYLVTIIISLMTLSGLYCKFRTTTVGSRIIRVIPTVVFLTVIALVMTACFTVLAVPSISHGEIQSFSAWLVNVSVTLGPASGVLVAVGVYVHFPAHLCRRSSHLGTRQLQSRISERQTIRPSEIDHYNVPSYTVSKIAHETVTATESSRLIDEQLRYQKYNA